MLRHTAAGYRPLMPRFCRENIMRRQVMPSRHRHHFDEMRPTSIEVDTIEYQGHAPEGVEPTSHEQVRQKW